MKTEISVDLAVVRAKDPLRALADVRLQWLGGEVTIRRCAVFEEPNEPPWATLPRLRIEKNGKREFMPLIELGRGLRQRVLGAVLEEYARHPR